MSNNSCQTVGVSTRGSKASRSGLAESAVVDNGFAMKVCALFRGRWRLSPSKTRSCLPERLSRRRVAPAMGDGYEHSRPEFSHDRHAVPTPLFTHFTLERRQRMQAMLERIRPCACLGGDSPAAVRLSCPAEAMVLAVGERG